MTEMLKVKADKVAMKKPSKECAPTKKDSLDEMKANLEAQYLQKKSASQIVRETMKNENPLR